MTDCDYSRYIEPSDGLICLSLITPLCIACNVGRKNISAENGNMFTYSPSPSKYFNVGTTKVTKIMTRNILTTKITTTNVMSTPPQIMLKPTDVNSIEGNITTTNDTFSTISRGSLVSYFISELQPDFIDQENNETAAIIIIIIIILILFALLCCIFCVYRVSVSEGDPGFNKEFLKKLLP